MNQLAAIAINSAPTSTTAPAVYMSAVSTQTGNIITPYGITSVQGFTALNSNDINISGGGLNQFFFNQSGIYNIQFSIQATNSAPQAHLFWVWASINGFTVPDSGGVWTVHSTHGGNKGHAVLGFNYYLNLNAGDFFTLQWTADDTSVMLENVPSPGNPIPQSPVAILTIQKI